VVHLAVFTTSDPPRELMTLRDGVAETIEAPHAEQTQWARVYSGATFAEYQGRYGPSPNYQAGNLPFLSYTDGGQFEWRDGKPVVQSTFDLRFSIAVPDASACPEPPHGYPIVLYAHGTGGDFHSYLDDGTGVILAK